VNCKLIFKMVDMVFGYLLSGHDVLGNRQGSEIGLGKVIVVFEIGLLGNLAGCEVELMRIEAVGAETILRGTIAGREAR
jgi:hypothetical protein